MYGCECCISAKSIHPLLLSWYDKNFKNSKIKSKILKIEGAVKYKIAYMKHIKIQSCHMGVIFMPKHPIWKKSKICAYSQSDHALPHWKFLLWCC